MKYINFKKAFSICLALLLCVYSLQAQPSTNSAIANAQPVSHGALLEEVQTKLQRVQQFLTNQNLEGILLSRINNFSWVTAGIGDNHIVITSEVGPASLLIMKDGRKYLVANNTEVAHLMQEDLAGLGYEAKGFDWHEATGVTDPKLQIIQSLAGGKTIGTDVAYGDLKMVADEFAALRYQLTPSEIKKYRWVGQQTSEAVAAVCRTIKPGMTEKEIETLTSDALMKRGLRPTVILIGTDQRVLNYYHYPPQDKKLQRYAIVNVCARRWGLVASVARYVYFGSVPDSLKKAMNASAQICARMQAASKPGARAKEIFQQTKVWYQQFGFANYWKMIHVGGGIGYAEREWVASDESKETIGVNQAFAWNPFTKGALSFDTFIVTEKGMENISSLKDWPAIRVNLDKVTYVMPDILNRKL